MQRRIFSKIQCFNVILSSSLKTSACSNVNFFPDESGFIDLFDVLWKHLELRLQQLCVRIHTSQTLAPSGATAQYLCNLAPFLNYGTVDMCPPSLIRAVIRGLTFSTNETGVVSHLTLGKVVF